MHHHYYYYHIQGVLIETVEERRRQQVVTAMRQAELTLQQQQQQQQQHDITNPIPPTEADLLYVRIPTDTSQPLQQLSFRLPEEEEKEEVVDADKKEHCSSSTISSCMPQWSDGLLEHLQMTFHMQRDATATKATVDIELLRRQQEESTIQLLGAGLNHGNTNTNTPLTVSDTTLREVAEQQASIETFTLVQPTPSNQYTGIVLYLDEVGMLKRLPLNTRASDYCSRAGFHPAPVFYGDVYMGRIQHVPPLTSQQQQEQQQHKNGSTRLLKNLSFVLGPDTVFDAPWLRAATAQNLQYQQQLNQSTGRTDVRQAGVAGSDGNVKQEDGYTWTQTEQEIEILVPLPFDAISKHVLVKFHPLRVDVLYQKEPITTVQLFERVDVDACTWTLDNNAATTSASGDQQQPLKRLVISMEKLEEAYWPRIVD
jgi:CS domain